MMAWALLGEACNQVNWKLKGIIHLPGLETVFHQSNISEILPLYHLVTDVLMLILFILIFCWCII